MTRHQSLLPLYIENGSATKRELIEIGAVFNKIMHGPDFKLSSYTMVDET